MAAAADGVSRPSGHKQYQSDGEEYHSQDQDDMGEGERRDEARENEPEHDKDDSEDDHDVYLVSVRMFSRRVLRVNGGTRRLAWPAAGLALPRLVGALFGARAGIWSWWSAELRANQGERNGHAILNATGRYRNVRREQTLSKFSGVQPNSFRTGWRAQQLQRYTCWVAPAIRPDLTGHPYGLQWLAAESVVAVVIVGVQPGGSVR